MARKVLVIGDGAALVDMEGAEVIGAEVGFARSAEEGIVAYGSGEYELVVLDLEAGGAEGFGALERIRQMNPSAYVITVAGVREMGITVEAIKRGAFDFLSKPVDRAELLKSISKAFQNIDLHRELKDRTTDAFRDYRVDAIVGRSRAMEELYKMIAVASQSKVTVLVQGESGTGKELIARAIHYNSPQKERPFMAINCSALVETLLESELFGHEKGAFTGALFKKEGKFEAANGGTVFLDEIGEMSPALQVKLLRVLQERSFERVGGSDTIRTDVRVIAATNRDLKELIDRGLFREDLYWRLKVITMDVPPLRERREDIPLLIGHLLQKAGRDLHKHVSKAPERIMRQLIEYPWPGNVRELENVIMRGVLLAKDDVLIDVYLPGVSGPAKAPNDGGWRPSSMEEIEREHIARTLTYTGWNKSRAAVLLGISMPRLERKIKKYVLRPKAA